MWPTNFTEKSPLNAKTTLWELTAFWELLENLQASGGLCRELKQKGKAELWIYEALKEEQGGPATQTA